MPVVLVTLPKRLADRERSLGQQSAGNGNNRTRTVTPISVCLSTCRNFPWNGRDPCLDGGKNSLKTSG